MPDNVNRLNNYTDFGIIDTGRFPSFRNDPSVIARNFFAQNAGSFFQDQIARSRQNTFLTQDQFDRLFKQSTQPAIDTLSTHFNRLLGEGNQRLSNDFFSRGMGFGGSLTGAQAGFQSGLGQDFQDQIAQILGNAGTHLGELNLNLGAQRQGQAQQALLSFLQAILSGKTQIDVANLTKPRSGIQVAGVGGVTF